jgi:hypothetical protein
MTALRRKNKTGKSPRKYPGELGKRRRSSKGLDDPWGAAGLTGSDVKIRLILDWAMNLDYYESGIALIAKHFNIESTRVLVRRGTATGLAAGAELSGENNYEFWFELSLRLLQRHVPYFMLPTSRGRPPTLQSRFRALATLIDAIHGRGEMIRSYDRINAERISQGLAPLPPFRANMTVEQAYESVAKERGCSLETVRREFRRWIGPRGGNSAE